jgi:hypothetical protein
MYRKLGLTAAVALIAAIATAAVAVASDAPASARSAGDGDATEVIRLQSKDVKEALLALNPDPESPLGNEFVFAHDLFRGGDKVGALGGTGTVVRSDHRGGTLTLQLVVTAALPGGQITTQGLATFSEEGGDEAFRLAITGGTGRYRTAHGEVTVAEQSATQDRVTLRVVH